MVRRRQLVLAFSIAAIVSLGAIYLVPQPDIARQTLPEKLSDSEFWNLINDVSEPGGYFRSDNFVSNESTFQYVIPELRKKLKPGGVYLGVGPDQNLTYIAALHSKLAFITDIRRQNMLLHLMYKALFELSDTRADFLSKLFARPMVTALQKTANPEKLFEIFNNEDSDPDLARDNLAAIVQQLRVRHHFALSLEDSESIKYVYNNFVSGGPEIRYSFPNQYAWRRFPSYSELMLETDIAGENHSYMASDGNFQEIKRLESDNRIIPIVGDFGGERALRAVGHYLKEHGATVTAFYTSNVEFYLFQTDDWRKFFNNVSQLPVDKDSVFIRSYFNNYGSIFPNGSGARSETLIDGIQDLMSAVNTGSIHSYFDVVKRSTAP